MHYLGNVYSCPAEEGPTGEKWWGLVTTKRFLLCPDTTSQDDELIVTTFGEQATFFFPCLSVGVGFRRYAFVFTLVLMSESTLCVCREGIR